MTEFEVALSTALIGAVLGGGIGYYAAMRAARYQVRMAKQEEVNAKVAGLLGPVLIPQIADRLKEDEEAHAQLLNQCANASRYLHLRGYGEAGNELHLILSRYDSAAHRYVNGELTKEDFERIRADTTDEVASLITRYQIELGPL